MAVTDSFSRVISGSTKTASYDKHDFHILLRQENTRLFNHTNGLLLGEFYEWLYGEINDECRALDASQHGGSPRGNYSAALDFDGLVNIKCHDEQARFEHHCSISS